MKGLKKLLVAALGLVAVVSMTGCGAKHTGTANDGITKNEDGTYTVRVGNTNASALLPTVFGPMQYGLEAYAWYYGEHENEGKVKIDFIHLDDGYSATTRAVNTEQLINRDKVFGIVYGYDDQANALEEANKVMVYTPLTMDYFHDADKEASPFLPIQPIDYVEGKQLVASAFAKGEAGFGASKVGVIAGLGTTGVDEVKGMRDEIKVLKKTENTDFFVQTAANDASTDYTAAVTALKNANVDVVILTDVTFLSVIGAIIAANWEGVKVLASYKFSNAYYLSAAYAAGILNQNRGLFTTGWIAAGPQNLSTLSEWEHYVEVLTLYSKHMNDGLITTREAEQSKVGGSPDVVGDLQDKYTWAADGVSSYFFDSYTMAGYEGMYVFAEGLTYLYKAKLLEGASTEDYVAQFEKNGMHIPMSTVEVSLKDGQRTGAVAMTLVQVTDNNFTLGEAYRDFYDLPALEKAAK